MGESGDATNDKGGGAWTPPTRNGRLPILIVLVAACVVLLLFTAGRREPGPSIEPPAALRSAQSNAPSSKRPLLGVQPRALNEDEGGPFGQEEDPRVAVVGRIRRGSNPVGGHTVILRAPRDATTRVWSLAALPQVTAGVTGARGEFRLVGRPGPYVLQVGALAGALHLQVSAPTLEPLDIDLAAMGEIVVTVRSPALQPLARAVVGVRAADGRLRLVAATDADGTASFAALPSGHYVAYAAPPAGQISFAADGPAVDLTAPDTAAVEVLLSAADMAARPQPRAMRITLPGTSSFEGWQARAMYRGTTEWVAVNGNVPVQIMRGLDVRAPDGRRWKIRATNAEIAAGILELPSSEVRWRGLLLDRKTNKPLAGYTVFARATSSHRAWIGSRTDASGEFDVRAVQAPRIRLTFYDSDDVKLRGISFEVIEAVTSSDSTIQVRIPLPGPDGVLNIPIRRMTGSVRRGDGSTLPASGEIESAKGGGISVSARFRDPDGVLVLSTPRHTTGLTASGSYAIDVYLAGSYGATIHTEMTEEGRPGRTDSFEWIGFSTTHDFELD